MFIPDVPGFVFDVLQTEQLWDLDRRQSIPDIHLVSKEQNGDPPVFNICSESERGDVSSTNEKQYCETKTTWKNIENMLLAKTKRVLIFQKQ